LRTGGCCRIASEQTSQVDIFRNLPLVGSTLREEIGREIELGVVNDDPTFGLGQSGEARQVEGEQEEQKMDPERGACDVPMARLPPAIRHATEQVDIQRNGALGRYCYDLGHGVRR
jgi:hypothetical protein